MPDDKFRYAVIYDANPTVGEEATVTVVDADGNVESFTHIAEDPDDDVPSVKPFFTPEQLAEMLEDDTTIRVSLRTEKP